MVKRKGTGMVTAVEIEDYQDVAEKKGKQTREGETWVAVRLPDWAREQLQEMAQEEDRSLSSALRRVVLEALPARDKGQDQ